MLRIYLNYPNSRLTVHRDLHCTFIQPTQKNDQRVCVIDIKSISSQLEKFNGNKYQFGSDRETNDMWVEINFQDEDFEMALLGYIYRLLGRRYKRFADASIQVHC